MRFCGIFCLDYLIECTKYDIFSVFSSRFITFHKEPRQRLMPHLLGRCSFTSVKNLTISKRASSRNSSYLIHVLKTHTSYITCRKFSVYTFLTYCYQSKYFCLACRQLQNSHVGKYFVKCVYINI